MSSRNSRRWAHVVGDSSPAAHSRASWVTVSRWWRKSTQGNRKKFFLMNQLVDFDFDFDFDFDLEKSMNSRKLRFIIPVKPVPAESWNDFASDRSRSRPPPMESG